MLAGTWVVLVRGRWELWTWIMAGWSLTLHRSESVIPIDAGLWNTEKLTDPCTHPPADDSTAAVCCACHCCLEFRSSVTVVVVAVEILTHPKMFLMLEPESTGWFMSDGG